MIRTTLAIGLVAAICASILTFRETDGQFPDRYQAVAMMESSDILALATANSPQLEYAYSLSEALGNVAPGATLYFPDDGLRIREWTGVKLAGFGMADSVVATSLTTSALEDTISVPSDAVIHTGEADADRSWEIILDPDGDHSSLVYMVPGPTNPNERIIETSLVNVDLAGDDA